MPAIRKVIIIKDSGRLKKIGVRSFVNQEYRLICFAYLEDGKTVVIAR